ncbi:MAG: hypothetical protein MJ180_00905 [Candidatus Gastranaerophilales bacterium]|nr:hypothetical protein [Candidatus Gastranaerophilales bacterium]
MVVRQKNYNSADVYFAEFYNVPKELISWFDDIVYENNCCLEKKEWKSKYNSYVVYDYEPFCSDGFEINIVISSVSLQNIGFIKYLYTKRRKLLDYLKRCFEN